jgi:hypothetical protein
MNDSDGLSVLDHLLDRNALRSAGVKADELHLRSPLPQLSKNITHSFRVTELVGIDTLTFARPKEFDYSLGREILLHVPVKNGAHI